jgi:hypothetical protein
LSCILPAKYAANSANRVVDVAAIPAWLQAHIEDAHNKSRDDDILNVFSKDHIQRLNTAFLRGKSPDNTNVEQSSTKRPFWDGIEKAIRHNSSTDQPGVPMSGLSRTLLESMTQLTTNTKEIWNGVIYKKLLDHLLRIVLRIHLAPRREERIQERAKAWTLSRQHGLEAGKTSKLKLGQWRRRVLDLSDELASYVSEDPSRHQVRVDVVLDKLRTLEKIRPTPVQTGFDSIKVQHSKLVEGTRTTNQLQPAALGPITGSLEDEEDDDDDDDDDDEDRQEGEKDTPGECYKNELTRYCEQ